MAAEIAGTIEVEKFQSQRVSFHTYSRDLYNEIIEGYPHQIFFNQIKILTSSNGILYSISNCDFKDISDFLLGNKGDFELRESNRGYFVMARTGDELMLVE